MSPPDKDEIRGKFYASHVVPFQFNDSGTNELRGFTDTNGVTGSAWIPDVVGARLETDLIVGDPPDHSSFTLVLETAFGNLPARMLPVGLKEHLSNDEGTFGLHFPEVSAAFQSGGFHLKGGFFSTPYTQEIACVQGDLGVLSHSYAWDHVPYGATELQIGGGDGDHFDITLQVNAGGDRFFNGMASGNILGGMWVTLTPSPKWTIVGRIDLGLKEGEQTGIMEFLGVYKPTNEWALSANVLSAWDAVPKGDGTKEIQQWWSVMTPVTYAPQDTPLKVTLRPEFVREADGSKHFSTTLGMMADLGGPRVGVEIRDDALHLGTDDQLNQFTIAVVADVSYLLKKSW